MPKRKSKKTKEEHKLEIWSFCILRGWDRIPQPTGFNRLYLMSDTRERMRLNFGDKDLSLEVKRKLTKTEKKVTPHKNTMWVVLNAAPYRLVEIGKGGLIFNEEEKKKSGNAKGKE